MKATLISIYLTHGKWYHQSKKIGAARFGIYWSLELGYMNIILEMDPILAVKWILEKTNP